MWPVFSRVNQVVYARRPSTSVPLFLDHISWIHISAKVDRTDLCHLQINKLRTKWYYIHLHPLLSKAVVNGRMSSNITNAHLATAAFRTVALCFPGSSLVRWGTSMWWPAQTACSSSVHASEYKPSKGSLPNNLVISEAHSRTEHLTTMRHAVLNIVELWITLRNIIFILSDSR